MDQNPAPRESGKSRKRKLQTPTKNCISPKVHTVKPIPCLYPLKALDQALFDHWILMIFQPPCDDVVAMHQLGQVYYYCSIKSESIALRAILASSAAHLLSLGKIPATTFMILQRKAFEALRHSLGTLMRTPNTLTHNGSLHHGRHIPLSSLDNGTIISSLLLIGDEIIRPDEKHSTTRAHFLLQGTCALVNERYKYFECTCLNSHPARLEPRYKLDSPYFRSAVQSVFWVDIMSCVPCVRPPILDKKYWPEELNYTAQQETIALRDNSRLPCYIGLLSLLGDCATAVYRLYTYAISSEEFTERQIQLNLQLEEAIAELSISETESSSSDTPRENPGKLTRLAVVDDRGLYVGATVSHGLANRIFLLRATDHKHNSPPIRDLCDRLYQSLSKIPVSHSVATMLLWPLWVLGCESHLDTDDNWRGFVVTFLQEIYERQCIGNVMKCLTTLRERIWTLDVSTPSEAGGDKTDNHLVQQFSWVKHCWNQDIRLLLA